MYFQEGEFSWTPETQGLILGSFFYGYIMTQLLGGYLALQLGGKYVYGVGIAMTAVLTILTPVAARTGVAYLVACRVLMGVFEVTICLRLHHRLTFL